jgi:hypothetical protein
MARSVTDAAILLGVMQTPFGAVAGQPLPTDYTQFLQRGSLQGKRIGRAGSSEVRGGPALLSTPREQSDASARVVFCQPWNSRPASTALT